jgi:hypothetical protein
VLKEKADLTQEKHACLHKNIIANNDVNITVEIIFEVLEANMLLWRQTCIICVKSVFPEA